MRVGVEDEGAGAERFAIDRAFALDLTEDGAAARLAEEAGEVDILINNAGAIPPGRLSEIDDAEWRAVWELKLFGYIDLIRAVYLRMAAAGGGAIVNICGAVANAALIAFAQALGGDSMNDGIRVVGLNPGPTETEHLVRLTRNPVAEKRGDAERCSRRARGDGGRDRDTAAFLASPRRAPPTSPARW